MEVPWFFVSMLNNNNKRCLSSLIDDFAVLMGESKALAARPFDEAEQSLESLHENPDGGFERTEMARKCEL
jgi:hypothetical protein